MFRSFAIDSEKFQINLEAINKRSGSQRGGGALANELLISLQVEHVPWVENENPGYLQVHNLESISTGQIEYEKSFHSPIKTEWKSPVDVFIFMYSSKLSVNQKKTSLKIITLGFLF